jgi:hypothetical protein
MPASQLPARARRQPHPQAAEELGDAPSIFERLALDETDEVLIVAEKVEEAADIRLDRILG